MRTVFAIGHILIGVILLASGPASAQESAAMRDPLVTPFTNEVSFYKNLDDSGDDRGKTLQIISINGFNVGTDFVLEFTGDFNWGLSTLPDIDYDYYIELSLVKPVYKSLSLNYQRIYGTYEDRPINQFGVRLSFFAN